MSALELGDIAARLAGLSRDLDRQTNSAEELDRKAVLAKHAYEIAFSKAFLSGEGSVDARKHKAVIVTDALKLDAEIADQVLRACRARIGTIKVQIETGRSLSSAMKAEISLAGSGYST